MKFLVDATVLCAPTIPTSNARVADWLRRHERNIAVDAIILGESRFGILLLPRGRRRAGLERWFEDGMQRLVCLSRDAKVGLRSAELLARLRAAGRAMLITDSLIAASALVQDLVLVTRHRADFTAAGVNIINPFAPQR